MKTTKARRFCDISFFLALAFKMFSLGLTYFPVLDDYIQYGGYPLYDKLSYVYFDIGTISARPFATLLDPALWGQMYPHLWIVLLIISILFFCGVKLISSSFERTGIFVTPFLYAVVLLIPLGFEGTYWISASSRICVGLFFTGLAVFLLTKILTEDKKILMLPYILLTVLSFGFYESVMVLSALLQFIVLLGFVKSNKKRALYLLIPLLSGMAMFIYYKLAANIGAMGSRANGFQVSMLYNNICELFIQLYEIIIKGGIVTTTIGAIDGLGIILNGRFLLLVLITAIAGACAFFGSRAQFMAKAKYCIPIGLALTVLPLVPYLLTHTVWLTYRSAVPLFIGLVLTSAGILGFLLKYKKVRVVLIFVMVFVFSLGNISELATYKRVSETDNFLISQIAQQLDNDVLTGEKEAIVVYKESDTYTYQTSYYKDHVKSVFDSDWALTGAVRAKTRNINIKMITPVFSLEGIDTQGKQIIYLGGSNG